jgi:hypothetical protein
LIRLAGRVAVVVVLATSLVACQAYTAAPTTSPKRQATSEPFGSASHQPAPSSGQPSTSGEVAWGPLAVADDPALEGLDAGLGPGRLVVGPQVRDPADREGRPSDHPHLAQWADQLGPGLPPDRLH